MRAGWVRPEDVSILRPRCAEEVRLLEPDLRALWSQVGETIDDDIIDWLCANPDALYVLEYQGQTVGVIRLDTDAHDGDMGQRSARIHGALMPDAEGKGIAHHAVRAVLAHAFGELRRKKIIAKIDPTRPALVGFCRRWGFSRINHEASGLDVYRLRKADFERLTA